MAQLFHYHWWTEKLEAMETFYSELGFTVNQRIGRFNGEMMPFNQPLTWDDFRDQKIMFKIIEMRKGKTNVTFGLGKSDILDHIGFIVNEKEYQEILTNARLLDWKINENSRRTFISTPWKFRIELQKRLEVVNDDEDPIIRKMVLHVPFKVLPEIMAEVLGLPEVVKTTNQVNIKSPEYELVFISDHNTVLNTVEFSSNQTFEVVDPVSTKLKTIL
ncbi:hypothetical protein [Neobacillus massiliamazoniensis]|uniref:Glyoxalase-like domain-containing protein n=1 Tax=Neobacillus massiliamazoniensis TaxID=1499688 RepID=A0A0U1NSD0_9BACI|nr:hypothetical protein [Neobacillus massiliamazoniensis]CRK80855.1 hypothetical protein BN000_00744 [Neobacillus massiliamazoniensis]